MTRIASRLFIVSALAVGGFLAVSNLPAVSADLPAAPTGAGTPAVTSSHTNPQDADLSRWQETRLKIRTSNVIP